MPLYAGICQSDITPPLGVWMCGYALRPTGCVGVHDPLKACALVLNDGKTALALVAMDLLGLDFDLVDRVRQGITEQTGIPSGAIMLSATHTHGGPNVREFTCMGSRDPLYVEMLVRKLVGIVVQAFHKMRPASLAYGRAPVQIGVNRRQTSPGGPTVLGCNWSGPVAPNVDALLVRDSRGGPMALLFSHACHPTTLGGENLLITGDYCGFACDRVEYELDGDTTAFFLQGCAGNINPHPRGTFEDAKKHGRELAMAALEALSAAEPLASSRLGFAEETVELPLIPPPSAAECEETISRLSAQLDEDRLGGQIGRIMHTDGLLNFTRYQLSFAQDRNAKLSKPFTIQAFNIYGARVLGLPAEMFVQYALDFERQASVPVFSVAYSNGVHGYVPTAADYPYGGYEVDMAYKYYGTLMYTPGCELIIRKAAYKLMGIEKPDYTPYAVDV